MNALELRLGNYVNIDNPKSHPQIKGVPVQVLEIKSKGNPLNEILFPKSLGSISMIYGDEQFNQFDEFVKPIPLTEKWLKDFGLDKGWIPEFNKGINVTVFQNGVSYSLKRGTIKIEYVHQLQNFWYANTQEELKLI